MSNFFFLLKCIIPITICLLLLSGCNQSLIQRWEDIRMMSWKKSQVITHQINLSDTSAQYTLQLGLRHWQSISPRAIVVSLGITSPDKKTTTKDYTLWIKDDKGEVIGEAMFELVDLVQTVEANWKITQKGDYIFKIQQKSNEDQIKDIMEVGLVLVKK